MKLASNLEMNKNQALNMLLQQIAGNHGTPVEALIWYDSTAKAIKFHNGTAVQTLGVSGAGGDATTLDGLDSLHFLDRTNHTGTQLAATISDFATAVLGVSGIATDSEVTTQINALIDAAPGTMDTLNELAAALGDDPNFATTVTDAINVKPDKFSGNVGNGSLTTIPVTHNLGTTDVICNVYRANAQIWPDVSVVDGNSLNLIYTVAPAASDRVVVVG